jgi:asparagine synthase (glutamine-hydrolysing)
MSGILAIIERSDGQIDHEIMSVLMAAGAARAVDGANYWCQGAIGLGHHHFRVTPQEQDEIQPLVQENGRLAITADVRLDNRVELIRALDLEPKWAAEQSDCMLLLLAYRHWSLDCMMHLEGDFAFAIWDGIEKQLFLARDPLGVRQLYYLLNNRFFLAATVIDVLLAHPDVELRANPMRVAEYLTRQMDYDRETFFEGVYTLPPGHCLLVSAEESREWRYWSIDLSYRLRYKNPDDYAEHFLTLLRQSVSNRLRSGGTVGISLSGGLDSTSITAVAATDNEQPNEGPGRLRGYSYIFRRLRSCNESDYISSVVDKYDIRQTNVLGDDCWPLRDLADWPVPADPISPDPYWWLLIRLMKAAQADNVRLMLTGHFGDWLFGGAEYWAADMLRDLRLNALWSLLKSDDVENKREHLVKNGFRQFVPFIMRERYRNIRPRDHLTSYPYLHSKLVRLAGLDEHLAGRRPSRGLDIPRMWNRFRDLTFGSISSSMADLVTLWNSYGIELWEPYRDRRLVEYVLTVPADQLGLPIPGQSKRMLRKAMKGLLPDMVRLRRNKTVFWELYLFGLLDKERQTVERILHQPQIIHREFIDPDWLAAALPNGCNLSEAGFALWRCVTLELWLNRYQPK